MHARGSRSIKKGVSGAALAARLHARLGETRGGGAERRSRGNSSSWEWDHLSRAAGGHDRGDDWKRASQRWSRQEMANIGRSLFIQMASGGGRARCFVRARWEVRCMCGAIARGGRVSHRGGVARVDAYTYAHRSVSIWVQGEWDPTLISLGLGSSAAFGLDRTQQG